VPGRYQLEVQVSPLRARTGLIEAKNDWTEAIYPLLAELSLFRRAALRAILTKTPHCFELPMNLGRCQQHN